MWGMFAQVMGMQQLEEVRRAEVGVNMPGSLLRNAAQGCVSRSVGVVEN